MDEFVKNNPFSYDFEEQRAYESFFTQRNAQYTQVAEEVFEATPLEVFRFGVEAPTPQLQQVDGYDSEEEIANGDGGDDGQGGEDQGEGGDDNGGNTDNPTDTPTDGETTNP